MQIFLLAIAIGVFRARFFYGRLIGLGNCGNVLLAMGVLCLGIGLQAMRNNFASAGLVEGVRIIRCFHRRALYFIPLLDNTSVFFNIA